MTTQTKLTAEEVLLVYHNYCLKVCYDAAY